MTLEWIMILIILIPIVAFAVVRAEGGWRTNIKQVLRQIAGNFLLVAGLLLLFPSFYLLLYGKEGNAGPGLLAVSLILTAGGHFLTNRTGRKPDRTPGN
jgi:formate hydrogenlyase subunit 3/multisubunit Na+/H+ antiporter MnhD subunit